MNPSFGEKLLRAWQFWRNKPLGPWLFSRKVGKVAPYSGTIHAVVRQLEKGFAELTLKDHPGLRNHLDSIHAVAQLNLLELTTGLAMLTALPNGIRGIVLELSIQYHKKARGQLSATASFTLPSLTGEKQEVEISGIIKNSNGETVSVGKAKWLLSQET